MLNSFKLLFLVKFLIKTSLIHSSNTLFFPLIWLLIFHYTTVFALVLPWKWKWAEYLTTGEIYIFFFFYFFDEQEKIRNRWRKIEKLLLSTQKWKARMEAILCISGGVIFHCIHFVHHFCCSKDFKMKFEKCSLQF